jgi:SPP1 gp7 family putative phage head morphogenesis protein
LERYSNGVVYRIIAKLNQSDTRLYAQLVEALESNGSGSFKAERLASLLGSVRATNAAAYELIGKELTEELKAFTIYELSYQAQMLATAVPVSFAAVSPAQVFAAAYAQPFRVSKDGAVPMAQYLANLTDARAKSIRDAVSLGFLEGETTDSIVRRIKGTKAKQYEDGLMNRSRSDIEGMVRTALNHTANVAQQQTYKANQDVLKGWMFHATMDGRTSLTCAALNGSVHPIGKGPIPPRHIRCRSAAAPVVKSFRDMGIDLPEIVVIGKTRASMDGQIAATTTFSEFSGRDFGCYTGKVVPCERDGSGQVHQQQGNRL